MSTTSQKAKMGKAIVDFEARRDSKGRIAVYSLPKGDGGGSYEVAGINERYHPAKAASLRALIMAGKYEQAEREVADYIMQYTNPVESWLGGKSPGAEFYLRDTFFNAGPGGSAKVLQMAVGSKADGVVGPNTKSALAGFIAKKGEKQLLQAVHDARWQYMQGKSKNHGKAQFWNGWKNRMNNALKAAKEIEQYN